MFPAERRGTTGIDTDDSINSNLDPYWTVIPIGHCHVVITHLSTYWLALVVESYWVVSPSLGA